MKTEEIVIPTELKTYLTDIVDGRFGYKLAPPWKFGEDTLGVVVPILRETAPERQYTTMYEVLKDLNINDSGRIDVVNLQNKTGMAIFIRAGTIFTGETQNRAAQHSGVFSKEEDAIPVRCVYQSHGISPGKGMKYGDIAPPSVTVNLMRGNQFEVWDSVERYTCEAPYTSVGRTDEPYGASRTSSMGRRMRSNTHHLMSPSPIGYVGTFRTRHASFSDGKGSDNLLGHLEKEKGQSVIDDMMQRVPLFPYQVGAIIFNPLGVIALETFDHPKSWEAIKKEIIEKYGDKIKEKQAEHLFELKPEMIVPSLKKFIEGLDEFKEKTIRKDNYSETREVVGNDVIGEYTLVKGQPVHVLLLKKAM